ncbi:MAG: glycosyltransferase [Paludibacteraceae bacterium]|nr:glycosyltransferase [Paludibacteraceae bacterium]
MKIIILGTAWPYRGGLAAYNERLARQWQQEGHTVEIRTFSLQYPSFLFPGKTQYSSEPAPEDLRISRGVNSVNPLNWWKVGREIARERPDLLLIKFWIPYMAPCLATIARMVRRNGHTRVVSVLDNVLPHEARPFDRLLVRYFVGAADGFIYMSKSVGGDLALFNTSKPRKFCPHPLYDNFGQPLPREEALRRLNLPADGHYLLFFGFIREYKGLDWLLQAMADERVRQTGVRLIVAGEFYGDARKYEDLARSLNLSDTVLWHTRFISDSEVNVYFSACDLVVQPYKSATQSGVTQVAYHFDKPMVVTRVGGLDELVPDGKVGYVVNPSPEAVADAIVRFLAKDDPGCFTEGIREEKSKYSWHRMCQTIGQLLSEMSSGV